MSGTAGLWGAVAVWLLLCCGAVWWSHKRAVEEPVWRIGDALGGLLVMIWASSLGSVIFMRAATGTWSPEGAVSLVPAVLGTGAGGLVTVAFIVARASLSGLGFVATSRRWVLLSVAWMGGFLSISMLWGLALQALGVASQQEIGLVVMESWPSAEAVLMISYGVLMAPLVEEVLFRGFLLPPLVHRMGERGGIMVTAVLFGMMHIADPQAVPPLIVLGAILGWLRVRSGSLWPVLALHVGNNTIAFALLLLSQEIGVG